MTGESVEARLSVWDRLGENRRGERDGRRIFSASLITDLLHETGTWEDEWYGDGGWTPEPGKDLTDVEALVEERMGWAE